MNKLNFKKLFRLEVGSILLILFGTILLMNPDFGSAAVAAILGWILIGGGAAGLLIGFLSWPGLGIGELVGSCALLGAGIYLLKNPLMLASLLGILLGILLASQGLGALRDALRVKRYGGFYQLGLILGIAMITLGLFLVFSPMATSRFVMTAAGLVMVACGIVNLVSHKKAAKYISASGSDDSVIDADN